MLDEADRMLDLGFEQDVRDIISYCAGPSVRQTAMFSATWPKSIRDLAAEFLRNPVKVGEGGGLRVHVSGTPCTCVWVQGASTHSPLSKRSIRTRSCRPCATSLPHEPHGDTQIGLLPRYKNI